MSAKLNVCTHCLGDLFADGRCVQCNASVVGGTRREPIRTPALAAQIVHPRPLLN